MKPSVVRGDIAAQSADALVNATGTSLHMGTGVAGALLDAADGPLERDARVRGPVELGEVVVTEAYGLDADYVVHAAAMSHAGPPRSPRPTASARRRGTRSRRPTNAGVRRSSSRFSAVDTGDSTHARGRPPSVAWSGRTSPTGSGTYALSPTPTGRQRSSRRSSPSSRAAGEPGGRERCWSRRLRLERGRTRD